jgi:transcriptional regulator with XRE-family HTH domain
MVALPFCHLRLKATGTNPDYPKSLRSLGEQVRKKRLDLQLKREQVAEQLGVSCETLTNWEMGHREPQPEFIPSIIHFLGYDPFPKPSSFGEKLSQERLRRGLSRRGLGALVRVDKARLGRWEEGRSKPSLVVASRVASFFGWSESDPFR